MFMTWQQFRMITPEERGRLIAEELAEIEAKDK
jgi:hypothetical protein